MQRRYREKKYYCGEYLEVAIYPVYTHPKKRGKRSKPTTEIQQRLNQRHTEGWLRRLLHTNFTDADLFATLTFDDANLPASVEDAQRLPQNFLRRLKRKYARLGLDAKYIYVLEYGQEHNRLHIRLVLTGSITRAELAKLWGMGSASADALRFEADGLATLAKYIGFINPANLTIEEAAACFGIGQNQLWELTEDKQRKSVLFVGTKQLIERRLFDGTGVFYITEKFT